MPRTLGSGGGRKKRDNITPFPKAGNGGDGRPLTPQDNISAEERAKREAEAIKLQAISGVAAILKAEAVVAEIEAEIQARLKPAKATVTSLYRDLKMKTNMTREDVADKKRHLGKTEDVVKADELRRANQRSWWGLPSGHSQQQQELDARLPDVERDAIGWRAAGYSVGISDGDSSPPTACVAQGHVPAWSDGVKDGQAALKAAKEATFGAPEPEPEPEETPYQRKKREKAEETRLRASMDAMEDGTATDADRARVEAANKDLGAEVLDAIAEAEPEIVAQVVEDHAEGEAV
jgi:hypothetical protein